MIWLSILAIVCMAAALVGLLKLQALKQDLRLLTAVNIKARLSARELIEILRFRLQRPSSLGAVVLDRVLQPLSRSGVLSAEPLREVLRGVGERMRFDAAALIFHDSSGKPLAVVQGASSQELTRELSYFAEPFLSGRSMLPIGLQDYALSESVFGNFRLHGFRYTYTVPVISKTRRGLLWLGYKEDRMPQSEDLMLLQHIARDLAAELETQLTLHGLQQRAHQAESNNEEKSECLAQLSHDMRSPLYNVISILNLLKLENEDSGKSELFEVASHNCETLGEMIEDVLDLTRFRAGKLVAEPRRFDVVAMVRSCVNSFLYNAKAKGLEIQLSLPNEAWVIADAKHIKRVLSNLLGNAIKYTKYGSVSVSVEADRLDGIGIVVTDTGVGMDRQQLDRLFSPFTRFHGVEVEGIGLGLAVSKILVELSKGRVSVRSEPRCGSEFSVLLPRAERAPGRVREIVTPKSERRRFEGLELSVLVADDNVDCAESLGRLLQSMGLRVHVAVSTADALSLVNFARPDAVISDAQMPDGGAMTILKALNERQLGIPLFVISGDDEIGRRVLAAGAAAVLAKPVNPDELAELLAVEMIDARPSARSVER